MRYTSDSLARIIHYMFRNLIKETFAWHLRHILKDSERHLGDLSYWRMCMCICAYMFICVTYAHVSLHMCIYIHILFSVPGKGERQRRADREGERCRSAGV